MEQKKETLLEIHDLTISFRMYDRLLSDYFDFIGKRL